MIRKIVHIDEEKCTGCGACASACHENAIGMVNGKARLLRDDYCDGMGDCLPECPSGAITIEERESMPYSETAVQENRQRLQLQERPTASHQGGCPGTRMRTLHPELAQKAEGVPACPSQLRNWPVQIKLAPVKAPYFDGARLLIAADCSAYCYAAFHQDFLQGKIALIGCPKLDGVDYSEKLMRILQSNEIESLTIVRMEVPCCGGLELAAKKALQGSGKFLPWQVITLSIDGKILDRK